MDLGFGLVEAEYQEHRVKRNDIPEGWLTTVFHTNRDIRKDY